MFLWAEKLALVLQLTCDPELAPRFGKVCLVAEKDDEAFTVYGRTDYWDIQWRFGGLSSVYNLRSL